jgi:MoxR-vWA-beta-propeller ternary system domain bpX4
MDAFEEFLGPLFEEGRIIFRRKPDPVTAPSSGAIGLLERAYADYRLDIAGAAIAFDAGIAGAAAEVVRQASWALVSHQDRVKDLERRLAMPHPPSTASHHLSADLVLRYLPQVHRRARALDPSDALVGLVKRVLRSWPLSGVLAGLDEGPTAPLDLGGHEGLMLLYAERLSGRATSMSAWRPSGRALDYVELIAAEAGGGGRDRDRDRERDRD